MKSKIRGASKNTKMIAKRGIILSGFNKGLERTPSVILLIAKRAYKTFKIGADRHIMERELAMVDKDDTVLRLMLIKEQNIKLQAIYLAHLSETKSNRLSMYVSKEHKDNTKLERAIAREKRQTAYQKAIDDLKRLSA